MIDKSISDLSKKYSKNMNKDKEFIVTSPKFGGVLPRTDYIGTPSNYELVRN